MPLQKTSQKIGNYYFNDLLITNKVIDNKWKTNYDGKTAIIIDPVYYLAGISIDEMNKFAEYVISIKKQYDLDRIVIVHSMEGITFEALNFLYNSLLPTARIHNINEDDIIVEFGAEPVIENAILFEKISHKLFNANPHKNTAFVNTYQVSHSILMRKEYQSLFLNTTPRIKSKKFLCFNRNLRPQRLLLLAHLLNRDLIKDSYYSMYFLNRPGNEINVASDLIKTFFPNDSEWATGILNQNSNMFPMNLNLVNENDNRHSIKEDTNLFNDSYFSVTTETKFCSDPDDMDSELNRYKLAFNMQMDCIFFTEKTWKPIAAKHPFIFVGAPFSLKVLRSLGYKTFDKHFDESYDTETDDTKRLERIVDEIERLSKLSDDEWLTIQADFQDILEYNHTVLKGKTNKVLRMFCEFNIGEN